MKTPSAAFFRTMGACGILAGFATLLLWLLPLIYGRPATLDARLALQDEPLYLIRQWLSFLNVFFVLLASWGLTVRKLPTAAASASTGMLFLLFYGAAELLGRATMLFVRDGRWAAQLRTTRDPATRESLLEAIRLFDQVWGGLFVLLLICFMLATLCFAISTRQGTGLEQWVSRLLFAASALAAVTLAARLGPVAALRPIAMWAYPLIQPASRLLLGIWLYREDPAHVRPGPEAFR